MKLFLIICGAILLCAYLIFNLRVFGQELPQCDVGTYQLDVSEKGERVCKEQPTGCPYGDSIPLGEACDKQAPQTNYEQDLVLGNWGK